MQDQTENGTDDATFCRVCGENHETASEARSHGRAAVAYQRKFGVSI